MHQIFSCSHTSVFASIIYENYPMRIRYELLWGSLFICQIDSGIPNLFGGKAGKQSAVLVAFDQIVDSAFLVAGTDHLFFCRLGLDQRHHKVGIRAVGDDESQEGVGADAAFACAYIRGGQLGEGFHRCVPAAGNISLHVDGLIFPDGLDKSDQIDSRSEGRPFDEIEHGPAAG